MGALNKCTKMTNTYIHIKYNVHQIFFLWSKVCILFLRIKFRWQFNCTKNLNVIRKIIYVPKKINSRRPRNSSLILFWRIAYGCPNALNLDGFCPIRQQIMSTVLGNTITLLVSNLDWLTPREAAAVYGTLNEPKTKSYRRGKEKGV